MTPCTLRTTVIALMIFVALPAMGQQYLLYAPQPAASGRKEPSQEGILVQEIEIKKGDTLTGLSRKYIGPGYYYPQILLFNSIENPDLIYAGDTLRIPLSQKEFTESKQVNGKPNRSSHRPKPSLDKEIAPKPHTRPLGKKSSLFTPNFELSVSDLNKIGAGKNSSGHTRKKAAVQTEKQRQRESVAETAVSEPKPAAHEQVSETSPTAAATSGQKLFEAAVKAYRHDDCRTALELLDRYLKDNSASPLAADATLYKAECFLKLSAQ